MTHQLHSHDGGRDTTNPWLFTASGLRQEVEVGINHGGAGIGKKKPGCLFPTHHNLPLVQSQEVFICANSAFNACS